MAGFSETCIHVATALFLTEAAVRLGLSIQACISKPCQWVPNNKAVNPVKIKDLKLTRGDFGRRKCKGHVDLTRIIKLVSGDTTLKQDVPALKHGNTMESEAVDAFTSIFKEKHKDVTVSNCGLFICTEIPFVGGSPDRIITCSCCGTSCLEFKCSFSILHITPSDESVKLHF